MNVVIEQLDYIIEWKNNASTIPINPATFSTIERLRNKQLQARREIEDDAVALENERLLKATVVNTFSFWLQDELNRTAKHVVETSDLKCSSRTLEMAKPANFQIDFGNHNYYEFINGVELAVEVVQKGIDFTHCVQFYLCEALGALRLYGYRGVAAPSQSGKDTHFAFLPLYRKINSTHPPQSSAEIGFLSRRQFIGAVTDRLNLRESKVQIQSTFNRVMLFSRSFNIETSQHVIFRASEWPWNAGSMRIAIAEAMESFFEIVDTDAGARPPIPM